MALSDLPIGHVAMAAKHFLQGLVPDHKVAFAPSPSQLAAEARRLWYAQIDTERRERQDAEMLEHRVEPMGEAEAEHRRQVVAEGLAKLTEATASAIRTPDAEAERVKRHMQRVADRDPRPLAERLGYGESEAAE